MNLVIPSKLQAGDEIRVIAPALSMSILSEETKNNAFKKFVNDLGLKVTFGEHTSEKNDFASSSIESRVRDIHNAFQDPKVKAIFTVIGGYNSNQLLEYIDWDIIKSNPKILCGFSDITALQNAILAKAGLITYYGPHYSTFGQKKLDEYTVDNLKKCLFSDDPYEIISSSYWSDDLWFINQDERNLTQNEGVWVINEGEATGTVVGGNLCTLNLLQGTEYMPEVEDVILFIEDDSESKAGNFDRDLQSLLQCLNIKQIKGVVIGRFQKESEMVKETLSDIIKSKKALAGIPVVANLDFGHTEPKTTFPLGGNVHLVASISTATVEITSH